MQSTLLQSHQDIDRRGLALARAIVSKLEKTESKRAGKKPAPSIVDGAHLKHRHCTRHGQSCWKKIGW